VLVRLASGGGGIVLGGTAMAGSRAGRVVCSGACIALLVNCGPGMLYTSCSSGRRCFRGLLCLLLCLLVVGTRVVIGVVAGGVGASLGVILSGVAGGALEVGVGIDLGLGVDLGL
jgi:hypothetical protein